MNKLRVILKSTLQAKLRNELIMRIESRIESNLLACCNPQCELHDKTRERKKLKIMKMMREMRRQNTILIDCWYGGEILS